MGRGRTERVLVSGAGGVFVAASRGLWIQRTSGEGGVVALDPPGLPAGTLFRDGARDGEGGVWLATRAGALHYEGGSVTRVVEANGLGSNDIHRVVVDREGNVWFGTEGGLSKLVPGPFALWNRFTGMQNRVGRAVAEDERGRIWVGTREGPAVQDGDVFRAVPLPPEVEDPRVYALAAAPGGGMLVGGTGRPRALPGRTAMSHRLLKLSGGVLVHQVALRRQ